MATENILENIAAGLTKEASVRNLFGEPVQANGKTIIPVASISYGFGGGFGQGNRKWKEKKNDTPDGKEHGGEGEGGGGGGGLRAVAKGVFEITPSGTRFIPATPYRHLLVGLVAGLLLKTLITSRRSR